MGNNEEEEKISQSGPPVINREPHFSKITVIIYS